MQEVGRSGMWAHVHVSACVPPRFVHFSRNNAHDSIDQLLKLTCSTFMGGGVRLRRTNRHTHRKYGRAGGGSAATGQQSRLPKLASCVALFASYQMRARAALGDAFTILGNGRAISTVHRRACFERQGAAIARQRIHHRQHASFPSARMTWGKGPGRGRVGGGDARRLRWSSR